MRLLDPAHRHALYTVSLTAAELVAAVSRKGRMGALNAAALSGIIGVIRTDWRGWAYRLAVHAALIERAMDLIGHHDLRGYDAMHLAAALGVADAQRESRVALLTFVSADNDQRQAAAAEGLPVEDPNAHP